MAGNGRPNGRSGRPSTEFLRTTQLRLENFRNIAEAVIEPHPRLNVFYGDNGAGKTSILEALFVLSRGKSFRTVRSEELIGPETGVFRIFLGLEHAGQPHRIGLERSGSNWKARRDGEDIGALSDLSRDLPLVLMEPNSHQLVAGPPDTRRRYLDWGVFHVERGFLDRWRRYARALKQRNAALRSRDARILDGLDPVLAECGERLNRSRMMHFERVAEQFPKSLDGEKAALQSVELQFLPGWKGESLAEALQRARVRDLEQGATSVGPHRAEIAIIRDGEAVRTVLSRGEQKGLAAALLLTQAKLLSGAGEAPVFLLDDLASEFDLAHLQGVLDKAMECADQVWVTGVEQLASDDPHKVFHVEHGAVREMV